MRQEDISVKVRIDPSYLRTIKKYAKDNGLKLTDLRGRIFSEWVERNVKGAKGE